MNNFFEFIGAVVCIVLSALIFLMVNMHDGIETEVKSRLQYASTLSDQEKIKLFTLCVDKYYLDCKEATDDYRKVNK